MLHPNGDKMTPGCSVTLRWKHHGAMKRQQRRKTTSFGSILVLSGYDDSVHRFSMICHDNSCHSLLELLYVEHIWLVEG